MGMLSYGTTQNASYYAHARTGGVFFATANVTAPVAYTTAAGTGGPLLWNGTGGVTILGGGEVGAPQAAISPAAQKDAVILGITYALTTAETTANVALGLTGGANQIAAPTSTTAIDSLACTLINRIPNAGPNGAGNACNVYRVGTVSAAGNWFFPLTSLSLTAINAQPMQPNFIDLHGLFTVEPGGWIAVSVSAASTAAVLQIGLVWTEIARR